MKVFRMKNSPWMRVTKILEPVLASKTFNTIEEVDLLVDYRYSHGVAIADILDEILKFNFKFNTQYINWERVVLGLIRSYKKRSVFYGDWDNVIISEFEINQIKAIPQRVVRELLWFYLILHKWNGHPSGWVHFVREAGFEFWNIADWSKGQKEETMQMCTACGLELRVVGNKEPIICYRIKWAEEETPNFGLKIKNEDDIERLYREVIENERTDI